MSKNKPLYIIKDADEAPMLIGKILGNFFAAWVFMLVFGALGHRLHIEFLKHLGYFDVVLIYIAFGIVRGVRVSKWGVFRP